MKEQSVEEIGTLCEVKKINMLWEELSLIHIVLVLVSGNEVRNMYRSSLSAS